jgi:hypothetical protein
MKRNVRLLPVFEPFWVAPKKEPKMDVLQEAMQTVEGRALIRIELTNLFRGYPLYQTLSVLVGAALDLAREQRIGKQQSVEIFKRTVDEIVENY